MGYLEQISGTKACKSYDQYKTSPIKNNQMQVTIISFSADCNNRATMTCYNIQQRRRLKTALGAVSSTSCFLSGLRLVLPLSLMSGRSDSPSFLPIYAKAPALSNSNGKADWGSFSFSTLARYRPCLSATCRSKMANISQINRFSFMINILNQRCMHEIGMAGSDWA